MQMVEEQSPEVNVPILCLHPFDDSKRLMVTPSRVRQINRATKSEDVCNSQLLLLVLKFDRKNQNTVT